MTVIADEHTVTIRALGREIRVTAIFTTADDANAYMATRPDEGVIAEIAGVVFLANIHDRASSPGS
ncbi:hypothetical protein [Hyphomicrobium sp. DY-1]|uniref:hypothetical protein n=1 Tax=Hyphomicrobium sp. DY-1 TaxID=3075650 RepID=UPI0039C0B096